MFGAYRNDDWMHDWFRNELRSFLDTGVDRSRTAGTRAASGVFPAVNIYDDGEAFLLRAELPGVEADSLDISTKGDQLVIRGERTVATPAPEANLHRQEREGGTFRRVVTFPQPIHGEKVRADLDFGVLKVYAPRAPESQPRRIEVNEITE